MELLNRVALFCTHGMGTVAIGSKNDKKDENDKNGKDTLPWKDQPATNETILTAMEAMLAGLGALTQCLTDKVTAYPAHANITAIAQELRNYAERKEAGK